MHLQVRRASSMKAPANVALEDAPTLALSGNAPLSALFANVSSLQLLSSAPKWRVFHAPEWRNCCEQPMRARMARRVRATSLAQRVRATNMAQRVRATNMAQRVLERVRANSMAQLMRARMTRRARWRGFCAPVWRGAPLARLTR